MNWNDAKACVSWLSSKTGKTYRLPSDTEREYMTRAGATTPFWWGASISTDRANYNGNSTYAQGTRGKWRQKTVSADNFSANPWGRSLRFIAFKGGVRELARKNLPSPAVSDFAVERERGKPIVVVSLGGGRKVRIAF